MIDEKKSFGKVRGEIMSDMYTPPFTMTDEITNLVIEIAEFTGAMTVSEQLSKNPKLRRENRIRSIHSSLAIEQNSLTMDQVSDIIDGKRVLGPPQDIREVQNAYEAYEIMTRLNPYSVRDLLKAHKIMTEGLVKEAGGQKQKRRRICRRAADSYWNTGQLCAGSDRSII